MSEKGRTEEFLDLYRKLEHIGREIYFPNSNNAHNRQTSSTPCFKRIQGRN